MSDVCSPLPAPDGTSVAEPCTGVGGVTWCGDADYFRWRRILQTERHALYDRLEALVRLIDEEGTAKWSVVTRAALTLCNEDSYNMLQHYPFPWLDAAQVIWKEGYIGPISQMAQMAARLHQATCEVGQALQAHGHAIPGEPTPPPPQLDWTDKILKQTQTLATSAAYLVAGGVVLVGGFVGLSWWMSRATASTPAPALPTGSTPALAPATRPLGGLPQAFPPTGGSPAATSVSVNRDRRS